MIKKRDFVKEIKDEIIKILEEHNGIDKEDKIFWIDDEVDEFSMHVDRVGKDDEGWFFEEDSSDGKDVWHLDDFDHIGPMYDIYEGITGILNGEVNIG